MISRFNLSTALVVTLVMAFASVGPVVADARLAQKIQTSEDVLRDLLATPDHEVPDELLERARCVAILP